uniref:Uncharacterized protein n=1 Tax=Setaria italica TaxID=4555 RepID=K4AP51_SETIT
MNQAPTPDQKIWCVSLHGLKHAYLTLICVNQQGWLRQGKLTKTPIRVQRT